MPCSDSDFISTLAKIYPKEPADDTAKEKITQVSVNLNDLMTRKGVKIDLAKYKLTRIEDMTKGVYFDVVADLTKLPDKVKK